MPRVPKKADLSEVDSPIQLTLESLQGLKRAELQALAKRYGVKGNLKTNDMITQLIVKNESNVSPPNVVKAKTGRKAERSRTAHIPEWTQAVADSVQEEGGQNAERASKPVNEVVSDAVLPDSDQTPVVSPRRSKRLAEPPISTTESETLKKRRKLAEVPVQPLIQKRIIRAPTVKDVWRIRRLIVTLSNETVAMRKELEQTKSIAAAGDRTIAEGTDTVKVSTWRRELYEEMILANMKSDRTLWDGTAHLIPSDRKRWREFLEAHWVPPTEKVDDESSVDDEEEGGRDGDNEMSDNEGRSAQPGSKATVEVDEFDHDDIYV